MGPQKKEPPHPVPSSSFLCTSLPSVLESPRDLQFSEIRETSARVSWTPPASRVDGFKVSYQLADGGNILRPVSLLFTPCTLPAPLFLLASPAASLPAHCVFPGEPQSVQVDGRTQKLEGLIPGAQYEVTVVSVRGFEESEPLTGFLTTGERDWDPGQEVGGENRALVGVESEWGRGGERGCWRLQWQTRSASEFGKLTGGERRRDQL